MNSPLAEEIRGRDGARPSKYAPLSLLPASLLFATLGLLWFILCRDLSLEWSSNEQYSYGWFVPFFAAFLFWLRFEDAPHLRSGSRLSVNGYSASAEPPHPTTNNQKLITIGTIIALAIIAPIRLFEVANPDWRPLSWVHALTVVGLTLLVLGYWGGKAAVRHFAFPVCFILVAVPWITPIEAPLVQWLMRLVASVATETLTLFGIPAQLEGSLIRVNNGVVGVSEACSGVRSLQTSLMIGLLFGELKRLTIARRVALVAVALTIALVANFGRAFFLVWIAATQNLAAVERWHDIAGYAIVGAVFVGTVALASWLAGQVRSQKEEGRSERKGKSQKEELRSSAELTSDLRPQASDPRSLPPDSRSSLSPSYFPLSTSPFRLPPALFLLGKPGRAFTCFVTATFAFLLSIETAVSMWYRWHERNFVPTTAWTVRWPEDAPGYREFPIDENIRSTLRYDSGGEAAWRFDPASPNEPPGLSGNCTMFFFRWEPGSASILRARAHRPDICLPNSGWRLTSDEGVRHFRAAGDLILPFRHFRFVRETSGAQSIFADAFFCQREDRVPPEKPDSSDVTGGKTGSWRRNDRVRVVLQGLRNQGQQVMEFVLMTRNPLSKDQAEAEFAALVPRLVKSEGRR
ncbi:MAG: exosortase/archaeosortase family protein [Chthoniobacterales bacterium]